MLYSTLQSWAEMEEDMFLVSEEGHKIYTQRILLSLYSSKVRDIIKSFPLDMIGISVPASSVSLGMLLKVLTTGSVISSQKMDLMDVGLAAEVLGVVLKNKQIGFEVKNLGSGKPSIKIENYKDNLVEKFGDLEKTNMEEDGSEFLIDGSTEVDYEEDTEVLEVSLSEVMDSPIKMESKCSVESVKEREICKLSWKNLLKKNLARHTESYDVKRKLFKCDCCDKSFSSSSGLRKHKPVHIGKTFKCELCDFATIHKINLMVHKLRHHKDHPASVQAQPTTQATEALPFESFNNYDGNEGEHGGRGVGSVVQQNEVAEEGYQDAGLVLVEHPDDLYKFCLRGEAWDKWTCSICYKYSGRRNNARNHVESKHYPKTFQYSCEKCDKIYNTKCALQVHNAVKHRATKNPVA